MAGPNVLRGLLLGGFLLLASGLFALPQPEGEGMASENSAPLAPDPRLSSESNGPNGSESPESFSQEGISDINLDPLVQEVDNRFMWLRYQFVLDDIPRDEYQSFPVWILEGGLRYNEQEIPLAGNRMIFIKDLQGELWPPNPVVPSENTLIQGTHHEFWIRGGDNFEYQDHEYDVDRLLEPWEAILAEDGEFRGHTFPPGSKIRFYRHDEYRPRIRLEGVLKESWFPEPTLIKHQGQEYLFSHVEWDEKGQPSFGTLAGDFVLNLPGYAINGLDAGPGGTVEFWPYHWNPENILPDGTRGDLGDPTDLSILDHPWVEYGSVVALSLGPNSSYRFQGVKPVSLNWEDGGYDFNNDGRSEKAYSLYFAQDLNYQGFQLKAGSPLVFYPNGQVSRLLLSQDDIREGVMFPQGTWVEFSAAGELLSSGEPLPEPTPQPRETGVPPGTTYSDARFRANGQFWSGIPDENVEVQGIWLQAGERISLNEDGSLNTGTFLGEVQYQGIWVHRYFRLYPDGRLWEAWSSQTQTIQGESVGANDPLYFTQSGEVRVR